jgi:hypothetical protein
MRRTGEHCMKDLFITMGARSSDSAAIFSDYPTLMERQNSTDSAVHESSVQDNDTTEAWKANIMASAGRKFVATDNGYRGWAPTGSQTGDLLVILPGGRVPYVLHPLKKRREATATRCHDGSESSSELASYQFLGDASIQGVMHGEVSDETKLEDIEIV